MSIDSKVIMFQIFSPGGNDTALVRGVEGDPKKRKMINDAIIQRHANVEQVGFVNLEPGKVELMMAGGEFCGNATRSTAHWALDGKPGEVQIKVSGVETPLRAGVDQSGNAWAEMPIYPETNNITDLGEGKKLVRMEGISHIVMPNIYSGAGSDELKSKALRILKDEGLDKSVPAAGVMFLTETDKGIKMDPVVRVNTIETEFYETACGSGTTATGLVAALEKGRSVDLSVWQPSGSPINIHVDFDGTRFNGARISGPVKILGKDLSIEL